MTPEPKKEAAPAHHDGKRPEESTARNCSDTGRAVQPDDLIGWARTAPLRDLLALLDPSAGIRSVVIGDEHDGPARCPFCRRWSVEVASAVHCWCALCRRTATRWRIAQLVLHNRPALERIAREVAA